LDLYLDDTWFVSRLGYLMLLNISWFSSAHPANFDTIPRIVWARGGALGWGTVLQARKSRVPSGVFGIFHWHNHSGRTIALGSTCLQQKWVPRVFPGGKDGRCIGPTTLPSSCPDCHEMWELLEPTVPVKGCTGVSLPVPRIGHIPLDSKSFLTHNLLIVLQSMYILSETLSALQNIPHKRQGIVLQVLE
jgi:hypothetical protein